MAIKANKSLIFLFSIIATIAVTQAQVPGVGRCPNVQTVQNFSVNAWSGTWYEQKRYPLVRKLLGKCTTATITPQPDGTIHVHISDVSPILENEHSLNGTAQVVGDGKLLLTFTNLPDVTNEEHWILGTDYVNYAVAYFCRKGVLNLSHTVNVFILTRERHPDATTLAAALNVLTEQNLSLIPLHDVDQNDCPN